MLYELSPNLKDQISHKIGEIHHLNMVYGPYTLSSPIQSFHTVGLPEDKNAARVSEIGIWNLSCSAFRRTFATSCPGGRKSHMKWPKDEAWLLLKKLPGVYGLDRGFM